MNLEDHIKNIREELDMVENVPETKIWEVVSKGLFSNRSFFPRYWWIVLVALVIVTGAWYIYAQQESESNKLLAYQNNEQWMANEQRFREITEAKLASLNIENLDQQTYGEILRELAFLDSVFVEKQSEMMGAPTVEIAIERAIQFHERRLKILELLSREIENQKRYINNENKYHL